MSENQTEKDQGFLMADRGGQLRCWTSWTGSQPVKPVPNQFRRLIKSSKFGQKVSNWIRKQTKETVLNSKPGWVRTRQRKVRGFSWLTEAASYGAEPVEPVSNWFRRLIKNPKFGQEVSNWIKKQIKETVHNSEPGWVRTRQRKVRGSSWLTEAASYGAEPIETVPNWFSRLIKNLKFGHDVSKWIRKQKKETVLNSKPGWVRTKQRKVRGSSWLTEATSYGADPVGPVPNRLRRLIKNPKFGQDVSNWVRKQKKKKRFSIPNRDEWE